ncbi:MAG: hypothetical protein RSP_15550 [Rhodanobacter sp.]
MLFDEQHDDSSISPIDQFFENTLRLNKLWATQGPGFILEPELGILLLLGYVSAVESYMRALIRRIVHVDAHAQTCCENQMLSFAAALHHKDAMLPEALLEESVFSGKKGILTAINKFVGLDLNQDREVTDLLDQYNNVCELRHCCVHRFGKLGTKNAVSLGLQGHKQFLEKPLKLGVADITKIADLLLTLVRVINNVMFKRVLTRTATSSTRGQVSVGPNWTWKKGRDKPKYLRYYMIFASEKDAQPSPNADEMYERFRAVFGSATGNGATTV